MFSMNYLEVEHWCQHESMREEFSPGTNVVIGPNGVGKSNFVNAGYTALTGRTMVGTLDENIKWNEESALIRLGFTVGGELGEITRSFKSPFKDNGEGEQVRSETKTTAKLEFGKKKYTGIKKVNETLDRILQIPQQVMGTHVFVPQKDLSKLLFQPASERLDMFLRMVPGIGAAEAIYKLLAEEIRMFPVIEVGVDIDELNKQLAETQEKKLVAEMALQQAKDEKEKLLVDEANDVIEQCRLSAAAKSSRLAVEGRMSTESTTLKNDKAALGKKSKELKDTKELMASVEDLIQKYREDLAVLESRKKEWRWRLGLEAELRTLKNEADGLEPPAKPDLPDEGSVATSEGELSEMKNEISISGKVMEILEKGYNKCPTCAQQFQDPAAKLIEEKANVARLKPLIKELKDELDRISASHDAYQKALSNYEAVSKNNEAGLARVRRDLEKFEGVAEPKGDDAEMEAAIKDYEVSKSYAESLETEVNTLTSEVAVATGKIEAMEQQRAGYLEVEGETPSEEEVQAAEIVIDESTRLSSKISRVEGEADALGHSTNQIEGQLESAKKSLMRAKKVKDYRRLVENTREVFHRSNLPQKVLSAYLRGLNIACNSFLSDFGKPFSVKIGNDLSIDCTFPSGYKPTAERLSGGEQCVLSVAFRLATNKLFAPQLGMVALDEPTEYMDENNLEYMAYLMEQIRQTSEATGMQTVVITHARPLVPVFDNVIEMAS